MITDDAIVAELSIQQPWRPSCRVNDVRVVDGVLDLQISSVGEPPARLRVPLPSTGRSQGWLTDEPDTAEHWVTLLLIWIVEEVDTGGLTSSRVREEIDGDSYVIVEGYGWRMSDPAEHAHRSKRRARWMVRQAAWMIQRIRNAGRHRWSSFTSA